jgi:hypothetical protein
VRAIRPFRTAIYSALILAGCGGTGPPPQAIEPDPAAALFAKNPEAAQALQEGMNQAINGVSARYKPLEYQYDEDLLAMLDRVEAGFAGKAAGEPPRFLPQLTAEEEAEHFRETIRRWEAQTGKGLRAEIDPLKAEVAARKADGPKFHPDFHRRFSDAFDALIKLEVEEMRERRNRELHREVEALFAKHRGGDGELVRYFEEQFDVPEYRLPVAAKGNTK